MKTPWFGKLECWHSTLHSECSKVNLKSKKLLAFNLPTAKAASFSLRALLTSPPELSSSPSIPTPSPRPIAINGLEIRDESRQGYCREERGSKQVFCAPGADSLCHRACLSYRNLCSRQFCVALCHCTAEQVNTDNQCPEPSSNSQL